MNDPAGIPAAAVEHAAPGRPATAAAKPDGDRAPACQASVSLYQKSAKIYARTAKGNFAKLRIAMVLLTQLVFYVGPWLQWNGRQALLFHLTERKFYLFGLVFWPQDVIYLAVMLIVSAYALFLVTAVAGRLFCGYACPQTVYTELFMWIENWVEGDRAARMRLDKAPLDGRKLRLKATKHGLWILLALWTGFTLVGYFTPMHELLGEVATFAFGPWETFWIFFYAGFCYLMAGFMRAQVCKYMCPYARFQSVMFDPDTLIITYDQERGEPRGARRKGAEAKNLGACVDCSVCVQVCPTGIDIRNGLQYECIGCAACIDACNEVMDKLKQPRGLVRYSTEKGMEHRLSAREIVPHVLRRRVLVYTAILGVILVLTGWFLAHRVPLKVDVIRDRGTLAREARDGSIENLYLLRFMNTDEQPHRYRIAVVGLEGIKVVGGSDVEVPSAGQKEVPIVVSAQPDPARHGSNPIHFEIAAEEDAAIRVSEKAAFMLQ